MTRLSVGTVVRSGGRYLIIVGHKETKPLTYVVRYLFRVDDTKTVRPVGQAFKTTRACMVVSDLPDGLRLAE